MQKPEQDAERIQIPDLANKLLVDANNTCNALPLNLEVFYPEMGVRKDAEEVLDTEPGPPPPKVERNAPDSPPREWRDIGGTIGVILYPREPKQ